MQDIRDAFSFLNPLTGIFSTSFSSFFMILRVAYTAVQLFTLNCSIYAGLMESSVRFFVASNSEEAKEHFLQKFKECVSLSGSYER